MSRGQVCRSSLWIQAASPSRPLPGTQSTPPIRLDRVRACLRTANLTLDVSTATSPADGSTAGYLGFEFLSIGLDRLRLRDPVDHR